MAKHLVDSAHHVVHPHSESTRLYNKRCFNIILLKVFLQTAQNQYHFKLHKFNSHPSIRKKHAGDNTMVPDGGNGRKVRAWNNRLCESEENSILRCLMAASRVIKENPLTSNCSVKH